MAQRGSGSSDEWGMLFAALTVVAFIVAFLLAGHYIFKWF
jgi:hypothetical protein